MFFKILGLEQGWRKFLRWRAQIADKFPEKLFRVWKT